MYDVLVVGAGPAGLMAADHLSALGYKVAVADRMPSPARKFLMAGRGGLNLTHSEPLPQFLARYREAGAFLKPSVETFTPDALRAWCLNLGQETFVGSSGRVFPKAMKASPLLRAWLNRLTEQEVELHRGMTWTGFGRAHRLAFQDKNGQPQQLAARSVLLALGGASWPRLGSDGGWVGLLAEKGVTVTPLRPANCGFQIAWSEQLKDRFAGTPLKSITLSLGDKSVTGEAMVSEQGLEGGAVYALSAEIRHQIEKTGEAIITLDMKPDLDIATLIDRLSAPRRKQTASTFLRKAARLSPVQISLLREAGPLPTGARELAGRIKSLPLKVLAPFNIERAISSAGGIRLDDVNDTMELKKLPGVFVAGEMLDWEAPTGGYLLQACFATGITAAKGISAYLEAPDSQPDDKNSPDEAAR
jgi:uncharacterized flavoprotein (TIGR03862 family)